LIYLETRHNLFPAKFTSCNNIAAVVGGVHR